MRLSFVLLSTLLHAAIAAPPIGIDHSSDNDLSWLPRPRMSASLVLCELYDVVKIAAGITNRIAVSTRECGNKIFGYGKTNRSILVMAVS